MALASTFSLMLGSRHDSEHLCPFILPPSALALLSVSHKHCFLLFPELWSLSVQVWVGSPEICHHHKRLRVRVRCVWRLENHFWELVVSFHLGSQGLDTGCQACVAKAFTL